MNKTKVARDLIIIAIIIIAALFAARLMVNKNASDGTVADNPQDTQEMPANHPGSSTHMGASPDLSAGDVAITLGDFTVGRDWLTAKTESMYAMAKSEKPDATKEQSEKEALAEGVRELVLLNGLKENGVEITDTDLAQRKTQWIEERGGEDAANELMSSVGKTWEDMEKLWRKELTDERLMNAIAAEQGWEAGSDFAKAAYDEWVWKAVLTCQPVFADPADKTKYEEQLQATIEARQSKSEGGGHGGMMGGEGSTDGSAADTESIE